MPVSDRHEAPLAQLSHVCPGFPEDVRVPDAEDFNLLQPNLPPELPPG